MYTECAKVHVIAKRKMAQTEQQIMQKKSRRAERAPTTKAKQRRDTW
jgi:hypothetical protein